MTARWLPLLLAVACVGGSPAHAQDPARGRDVPVQVRASADRTAMWVADRVRYDVEIRCARGVDVLDADLAPERLKLDGLEVVESETTSQTASDGTTTRRFSFVLTSYRVDVPVVAVLPTSLRYVVRRPGGRLEDAAPAGEVQAPGLRIAVRSTLPDEADTAALRDGRTALWRPRVYALAQPVGIGLVLVAAVPAMAWGIAVARRRRAKVARRSGRQVRHSEQASLDAIRALDLGSPEGRRDAYSRLDRLVRDHLHDVVGVPGRSLTATEVGPAVRDRRGRAPVESLEWLLGECERARYAPPDRLPTADECRDAIGRAEQVLALR